MDAEQTTTNYLSSCWPPSIRRAVLGARDGLVTAKCLTAPFALRYRIVRGVLL